MIGIIKSWFRKEPPITPEAAPLSEDLDKKVGDASKSRIKPIAPENNVTAQPSIQSSTPPKNAEAISLYALPMLYPKTPKYKNSSIVPINILSPPPSGKETNVTTPPLSDSSSKSNASKKPSKLEKNFKKLLSISEKAHKIILTGNQTVGTLIEIRFGTLIRETQDKMAKIDKKITFLKSVLKNETNPKMREWGEPEIEELEDAKLELDAELKRIPELTLLQELLTIEERASLYQKTVSKEVFPFETEYTSIQEELSSTETKLQGSFDLENPVDKTQHDLLTLKKEALSQIKQNLLDSCIDQMAELPSKMSNLKMKTESVEQEHLEFHSAFTSVYKEVLKAKKAELKQKDINLTKAIWILREDLKTTPVDNEKLEALKAISEESWGILCTKLLSLPKKTQDLLISKLEKQNCDPSIIRDLKTSFLDKEMPQITTYEDRLYFIDQMNLNEE